MPPSVSNMASPFQGGWRSASPRSSERALHGHEESNSDSIVESPRDEVTMAAEPHTMGGSPDPLPSGAGVGPSDEEIGCLANQLLLDETFSTQGPKVLDELASTIPEVAEIVEGLTMEAWQALYPFFGYQNPIRTPTLSMGTHRRYDFTCVICRRVHDRFNRARDCQYQDLGLIPYQCKGACSNADCPAAYNSEERLDRHLSSSARCPFCYRQISVQNAALHKTIYCLNRPMGPTVPESEAE